MKITNSKNPTFESRIRVVSPKFFEYQTRKMARNPKCEVITHWDIIPRLPNKNFCGYRTNVELGYTREVRTCTAGVVVNKDKPATLFMHLLNSAKNSRKISSLEHYFKGTNAILVGSKNEFSYSQVVFTKLKNRAANKNLPITIMQGLPKSWQADLAYTSKDDTLYLCVNNALDPTQYAKNMKQLNGIFRKIQISPTDTIEFISKIREKLIMLGFFS